MKKTRLTRSCQYCGASFDVQLHRLVRNPREGRFCSVLCSNKSRIGQPSPMRGKTRSEAFRRKCAAAKRPPPPPMSAETRAKHRDRLLGRKRDAAFREAARLATVRRHVAGVYAKKTNTAPERALAALLDRVGVPYERQVDLMWWVADFLIRPLALVLEADGDYWHANPAKYPGGPKNALQAATIRRDRRRDIAMAARGWTVVHFWEDDLLNRPDECEGRLRVVLAEAQARHGITP